MDRAPLKPVIDLLETVREGKVLQISGEPTFSVTAALNILSGMDPRELNSRPATRAERIGQSLGWNSHPNFSVLRSIDEAALTWAHNEGYFDRVLHVHAAPPLPNLSNPVDVVFPSTMVVHGRSTGDVDFLNNSPNPAYERLFLVYQQAAGDVFLNTPSPLCNSGLGSGEDALNTWALEWPSGRQSIGGHILRQAFSDAYAAVVLLIGSDGSADSVAVVKAMAQHRAQQRSTWDGNSPLEDFSMSGELLTTCLENWGQWKQLDAQQVRDCVLQQVGAQFGAWLRAQPLANTVIDELIPTFEQRIMDSALNGHPAVLGVVGTLFAPTVERLKQQESGGSGVVSLVHKIVHSTGIALGWMSNNDVVLQQHKEVFDQHRHGAVQQALSGLRNTNILSQKIEQYRAKNTTPDALKDKQQPPKIG